MKPPCRSFARIGWVTNTFVAALMMGCAWMAQAAKDQPGEISIVPKPAQLTPMPGAFLLKDNMPILVTAHEPEARQTAQFLADLLARSTGHVFVIQEAPPPALGRSKTHGGRPGLFIRRAIVLDLDRTRRDLGPEGYELNVSPRRARLSAATSAGLFYAVQTLRQMLPPEVETAGACRVRWAIPCARIVDHPRFSWRGMHLDVSRHFFGKAFIKQYLDTMALYKLNTFHWHLTDDGGWRLEIKKYPDLTRVGGLRGIEGNRYGGYYTREDIGEIVAYARQRHITIVPEIEMPSHCNAALYCYPELSCSGQRIATGRDSSRDFFLVQGRSAYCAGKENTFVFLQDVLSEVLELFPSPIIHIGGDERPKNAWINCPHCQARMKSEGLKTPKELQEYFIERIEKYLTARGRRMIGWEQIFAWEGWESKKLAPGSLVMAYYGPESSAKAARAGHDVVAAYVGNNYFDFHQSLNPSEPEAIGGLVTLETAYAFEPTLPGLAPEVEKHILGGQALLWTEYVYTHEHAQYMTYPRLCALAEAVWSPKAARDWRDFQGRLPAQLARLDRLGIFYRKPQPGELPAAEQVKP